MTSEREGVIYGLTDPRTDQVRYVGQTVRPVGVRLGAHITAARYKKGEGWQDNSYRGRWIRALEKEGVRPDIVVLAVVSGGQTALDAAEVKYISYLRSLGLPLTNVTAGGGGYVRAVQPAEHRVNISRGRGCTPFVDDLGRRYETMQEASKETGVPTSVISQILRGVRAVGNGRTFSWTDPAREAVRQAVVDRVKKMGRNRGRALVDQNGRVYESVGVAAREIGVTTATISGVLRGRIPQAKGFSFMLAPIPDVAPRKKKARTPIVDEVGRVYGSILEACRITGFVYRTIQNVLDGVKPSYKGHTFRYQEEV